jgi:hypothetical protein
MWENRISIAKNRAWPTEPPSLLSQKQQRDINVDIIK